MAKPTNRFKTGESRIVRADNPRTLPTRVEWRFVADGGWDDAAAIDTLNTSELFAVLRRHVDMAFDRIKELDNAARIAAVHEWVERTLAFGESSTVFTPAQFGPADESPAATPRPAAESTPAPAPAAGGLDSIIGTIAADAARAAVAAELANRERGQIDTAAVESIVDRMIADLRPTIVKVRDRAEVKIEERVHPMFGRVVKMLDAGIIPFLVGPAGTGKTYLARQVARAFDQPAVVVSCHPMMTRAELVGYMAPATNELNIGPIAEAWEMGALVLLDEMDASNPAALVTMNDSLASAAGQTMRFPDGRQVPRHERTRFVCTANTYGTGPTAQYVGRNPLDAATLDRVMNVAIDYDRKLESELVGPYLNGSSGAFLAAIERMRDNVTDNKLQAVVSTRGVHDAARAIALVGMSAADAVADRITKGIGPDQSAKLMAGVNLANVSAS